MGGGLIMQTYGFLFIIAIGCFGMALVCFSLISGDQDPMKQHALEEPHLYEGATPQFDVEVEPGTYQYDPATGQTNIPKNEFDLYMLYTIDNVDAKHLQLTPADQALTDKLKSPEGHWSQFPAAIQHMPVIWTIADHGLVLLRIK